MRAQLAGGILLAVALLGIQRGSTQPASPAALPGTAAYQPLEDAAPAMLRGMRQYLTDLSAARRRERLQIWLRLLKEGGGEVSQRLAPNRSRLRRILGVIDPLADGIRFQFPADASEAAPPERGAIRCRPVTWPVFEDYEGEGLLLRPAGRPRAAVVLVGDADQTPEALAGLGKSEGAPEQIGRKLASRGFLVLIPALLDRDCTYSGTPGVRMTNQPHREFIYRIAYQLGRHVIGMELQQILAARRAIKALDVSLPCGLFGYGEGGLLALSGMAVEDEFSAAVVSGHFRDRDQIQHEPVYRNVWQLFNLFGDAELALMSAPRRLIIEAAPGPSVSGPPQMEGRSGAAPGAISPPAPAEVAAEFERARRLWEAAGAPPENLVLIAPAEQPGGEPAMQALANALAPGSGAGRLKRVRGTGQDRAERQRRLLHRSLLLTKRWVREAPQKRAAFWAGIQRRDASTWAKRTDELRRYLHRESIGAMADAPAPTVAESRLVFERPAYLGYRVRLPVAGPIFAEGLLLLPKGIAAGERRAVVVCQHGLEGRPEDVAHPDINNPAYNQYACRLAEKGYVVFAPQNPYRGGNEFRQVQRMANPVGLSLFSFVVEQHRQIISWLKSRPWVDPERIAFYGLSYGGRTAMHIPPLLSEYCLSICSANFNEWVWKSCLPEERYSYVLTGEYEMPDFDIANRFNYAELSALIAPRPFMVERGHRDGVAPDEWVSYEYARTRLLYQDLGIPERTEIEYFDGPHTIHGVGTFEFLDRHLKVRGSAGR